MDDVWQLEEILSGWGSESIDRVWLFETKEAAKEFINLRRAGGYHFEYSIRPTRAWKNAENLRAYLVDRDEW